MENNKVTHSIGVFYFEIADSPAHTSSSIKSPRSQTFDLKLIIQLRTICKIRRNQEQFECTVHYARNVFSSNKQNEMLL